MARRLAKAIRADIQLYNCNESLSTDTEAMWKALAGPISEGRVLYRERVQPSVYGIFEEVISGLPDPCRESVKAARKVASEEGVLIEGMHLHEYETAIGKLEALSNNELLNLVEKDKHLAIGVFVMALPEAVVPARRRNWSQKELQKVQEILMVKIHSQNAAIRENAILGLGNLGSQDKDVLEVVRIGLKDPNEQVRRRAMIVLDVMIERTRAEKQP
jgi:hypothetical protein